VCAGLKCCHFRNKAEIITTLQKATTTTTEKELENAEKGLGKSRGAWQWRGWGWGQLGGNVDKVCTLLTGPNCDICVGWGHSGPKTNNWFLNLNEKAIKS